MPNPSAPNAYPSAPNSEPSGPNQKVVGVAQFLELRAAGTIPANGSGSVTSASFTPAVGDILVVELSTNTPTTAIGAITDSSGALTWTLQRSNTAAASCPAKLWTATVPPTWTAGTAVTVSVALTNTSTGAGYAEGVVARCTGGSLAGTPATAMVTGSAGTSTLNTTGTNSIVLWIAADYNGVSGAPTYAGAGRQLELYQTGSGILSTYVAVQAAAAAGSQTFGTTAPSGQSSTLIAVEVLAAGAAQSASAALTGVGTLGGPAQLVEQTSAALSGVGTLGGPAGLGEAAAAVLPGVGTLGATAGTPLSQLVDSFASASSEWTDSGASTTSGAAYINAAASGGSPVYASRRSRAIYSWPGYSITFGDVAMPGNAGDTANGQLWFRDPNPSGAVDRIGVEYDAATNHLTLRWQSGSYADQGTNVVLPYDPVAHRWFRLRHTGSTIVWDTSPDGLTWTLGQRTLTAPAWTTKTTLQASLEAFRSSGTNDTMRVGSINVAPTPLATSTPSPVDALQRRTLAEVRAWESWLSAAGARGWVGEFGWVTHWSGWGDTTQGAQWAALAEIYETELDVAGLSGTAWRSGRSAGSGDPLGEFVGPSAGDALSVAEPDAAGVIAAHPTRGAGSSTRWRGVSLSGYEAGVSTSGGGTVRGTSPYVHTAADFAFLAAHGVDLVRLPVAWERLQPTLSTALDAGALSDLDGMLTAARLAGVRVLIDIHNYGRYTNADSSASVLGDGTLTSAVFADLWSRLSTWLLGNATRSGTVVALGLMNEVHDLPGGLATWQSASQAALTAIRNAGDTRLVLVGGYAWASLTNWTATHGSAGWITDPSSNYCYEAHHYWDTQSAAAAGGPRSGTYQQDNGSGGVTTETYATELASAMTDQGAAALTGVGTFGAAAALPSSSAVLAGVGTLGGSALRTTTGTALLLGVGTLGAPEVLVEFTAAALTGVGSLAVTSSSSYADAGPAALTGVGTLGADSSTLAGSGAVLTGAGMLGATAPLPTSSATLVGVGTIGAAVFELLPASVILAGVGTMGAAGVPIAPGAAVLAGVGALGGTDYVAAAAAAVLAGAGSLGGSILRTTPAGVVLVGVGTLATPPASLTEVAAAAMTGIGTMGALAFVGSTTSLTGVGTMGVTAARLTEAAAAVLTGVGNLAGAGVRVTSSSAVLAGVGTIGPGAMLVERSTVVLAGVGALAGPAAEVAFAAAALTGVGSLPVVAVTVRPAAATLAGVGSFTAAALAPIAPGQAVLVGVGALAGAALVAHPLAAVLAGVGTLGAGGGVAAYTYTPLFVPPPGPVRAELPAAGYQVYAFHTRTGRVLWELPVLSQSWSEKLDDNSGTYTATLNVGDTYDHLSDQQISQPINALTAFLDGDWRNSIAVAYDGQIVWAGPYQPVTDPPDKLSVDIGGVVLGKLLEARWLFDPGTYGPLDAGATLSLGPGNKRSFVYSIVVAAVSGYGRDLPITCSSVPDSVGVEFGSYPGYDLATAWKAITDQVTADGGPDVRFAPYFTRDSSGLLYVVYDLQIGNPYLGVTDVPALVWNDDHALIQRQRDASARASSYAVPGSGQDAAKLIGTATDNSLVDIGFPALERSDSSHSSVTSQYDLDSFAAADLYAARDSVDAWTATVSANASPRLGTYRCGDDALLRMMNHPTIPRGTYRRRLTELAGDTSDQVKATFANDPVGV